MRRLMIIMLCLPFVFITHAQTDSPPRPIITPENAHQLTQIAQLGRGRILDVAFSEDESTLSVASTIGIWAYDMTDLSAEPIWTEIYLGGRGDYLSPNGRYVVINNVDRRGFKIYDIIRRQVVLEDDLQIDSSIFSPKSDRLAVRQSNRIYVVDIPTGYTSFYFDVPNHVEYVSHMRFSPDGKSFATVFVFEDNEVPNELWIWDIATSMEIRHFQISDTSDIEWSPDGETFIMNGGEDVHARLISATTGLDRQIFTSRFGPPLGGELSFSSDGQQVALASDSVVVYGSVPYNPQGIIYIWNVDFSEPMVILSGHVHRLDKAIFSPSGHYISGVGSDGMLRVWDARNGEILAHIREHAFNYTYSLNTNVGMLAVGDSETTVHIWDTNTFSENKLLRINERDKAVSFAQFSPDGRYLVTLQSETPITTWDTHTWEIAKTFFFQVYYGVIFHPTLPIISLKQNWFSSYDFLNYETGEDVSEGVVAYSHVNFSPNNQWLVYNGMPDDFDNNAVDLVVFDLQVSEDIAILNHPEAITEQYFSSDNQYLAVSISSNETWLWDTDTWTVRYILDGTTRGFSPDSQWIVTTLDNHTYNFYDVQTGEFVYTISIRPDKEMNNPVFSPDSRLMITATDGGIIQLRNTNTGNIITTIEALPLISNVFDRSKFPDVEWSLDGRLIMVSKNGVARIFAIPTEDMP